ARREVIRLQIGRRPVHVAVAADARQAAVKREVLAHQPGAEAHIVLPGVEGAVAVLRLAVGLTAHVEGRDIETGAESRAAVLAGAHA
nr:hypothetical protein [Tanacetum cinerariifolium]